ncbi:MAG: protein DA1 [Lentisphaeria bacterium]|nr:protein DA1 [Lentisphaeria bacterium]
MKRFLTIIFVLFSSVLWALNCTQCGKKIRGNYIISEGNNFCSEECFHATLPQCSYCQETCVNGYVTFCNQIFCSEHCMYQVYYCDFCKQGSMKLLNTEYFDGKTIMICQDCSQNNPKCYFCTLPTNHKKLSKNFYICHRCEKTSVTNPQKISNIFKKVRSDLAKLYKFEPNHHIDLIPISADKMQEMTRDLYISESNLTQMGLMSCQYFSKMQNGRKKLVIKNCKIYFVEKMPEIMLYETLAHELTHDYLRHNVGEIANLTNEEGFCELVASLYNDYRGKSFLNKRKEFNSDPVYGGGYRKMKQLFSQYKNLKSILPHLK